MSGFLPLASRDPDVCTQGRNQELTVPKGEGSWPQVPTSFLPVLCLKSAESAEDKGAYVVSARDAFPVGGGGGTGREDHSRLYRPCSLPEGMRQAMGMTTSLRGLCLEVSWPLGEEP